MVCRLAGERERRTRDGRRGGATTRGRGDDLGEATASARGAGRRGGGAMMVAVLAGGGGSTTSLGLASGAVCTYIGLTLAGSLDYAQLSETAYGS